MPNAPKAEPSDVRVSTRIPAGENNERFDPLTNRWLKPTAWPGQKWKDMSSTERDLISQRLALKKALSDQKKERVRWLWEKLKIGIERKYPEAYLDFVIDVLAGILAEYESEPRNKSHSLGAWEETEA